MSKFYVEKKVWEKTLETMICDICGATSANEYWPDDEIRIFTELRMYDTADIGFPEPNDIFTFDLCPKCMSIVKSFVETHKKTVEDAK